MSSVRSHCGKDDPVGQNPVLTKAGSRVYLMLLLHHQGLVASESFARAAG